jgi:hypothetical protein
MQSSGTFPQLSDGVRKTVTGTTPPKPKASPAPKPASSHRSGGHAKQSRRGK